MSRNIDPSSSLELLLDTICNTFGGIIFIAILTAILLQVSGEADEGRADPSRKSEQAASPAAIIAQRDALARAVKQQESLLRQSNPGGGQMELARFQELQAAEKRLLAELDAQHATVGNDEGAAAKAAARSRADEQELAAARDRLAALQIQLEREKKTHSREARLPKLHSTQKREIPVFVAQQRLSFLLLPDRLRSINQDDFEVEAGAAGTTVRLKTGHGTPLTGLSKAQVVEMISGFDPDKEYLAVFVTADSFDNFSELRAAMIERSLEYRLVPMAKNEPLHTGNGPGLVQ